MVLQFFCPICKEDYGNEDEIYSTQCGHVFHNGCIHDWLRRSSSCPCCQRSCGQVFKVYITSRILDDPQDVAENTRLRGELEKSVKSSSELQQRLDETECNFMELHLQLSEVENVRKELLNENQCLQAITESLQMELNAQKNENQNLSLDLEITQRRNVLNSANDNNANSHRFAIPHNSAANQELSTKNRLIEDLKKELNEKTAELLKEIRNSRVLIEDKVKMEELLQANSVADIYTKKPIFRSNKFPKTVTTGVAVCSATTNIAGPMNSVEKLNIIGGGAIKKPLRMEKQTYLLYQYAKKLHQFGFKAVFAENGSIFGKPFGTNTPIPIVSRQQVDDFINKFKSFSADVTGTF